ncbi:MAG: hypothetical protein IPG81_16135 [Sandaracinaceae bacterium]|jgi:hypothetical protein|nr:hypothetical protein [Sandaracinaceae bacterium]
MRQTIAGLVTFVLMSATLAACESESEACRSLRVRCESVLRAPGVYPDWEPICAAPFDDEQSCSRRATRAGQATNARAERWVEGGRVGTEPRFPPGAE